MRTHKISGWVLATGLALATFSSSAMANDDLDGKALYEANCAQCHGKTGEVSDFGKTLKPYPARNHRALAGYVSRDELRRIIAYGVKGTAMTPKKYTLDALEIDAVIDYMQTFEYKPNLANGKKRFEAVCASCHGANGRAKTGVGAKNLVYTKLNLEEIVHTMRYGRPGTLMTSKRHQLNNKDIADIANYVYDLRYEADTSKGKSLYAKSCQKCHATPADIKLIGNAASKRTVKDLDDHLLDLRIRHGRHVERSEKAVSKLSGDDIQDIIAYIRTELK